MKDDLGVARTTKSDYREGGKEGKSDTFRHVKKISVPDFLFISMCLCVCLFSDRKWRAGLFV